MQTQAQIASSPQETPALEVIAEQSMVVHNERPVLFEQDGIILCEVPFDLEAVTAQAQVYAAQGQKLIISGGHHLLYTDCFEILKRTDQRRLYVKTIIAPLLGKRRAGNDLPDHLMPTTKDSFDVMLLDGEEVVL